MTLSKRYDEVMKKIEVTDAMRRRILAKIDSMDLDAEPVPKTVRFSVVRRLMPLAACLALILAGAFSLKQLTPVETPTPTPSDRVQAVNGIVEVADADALRDAVGFPVREPAALPFRVVETTGFSRWGEVAEIVYTGEEQTATFRQSLGDGDNSGDYRVYAETLVREMDGLSVTLKGDGQVYSLAVWSDGTYAYSIRVGSGLTLPEWETVLADMK